MRPVATVGIAAAGALMIGVVMLCLTGGLMSELHPDPYEHTADYGFTGVSVGMPVAGSAHLTTVHENGSFHNYRVDYRSDDGTIDDVFYLVFGPDDIPSLLEREGDGSYSGSVDGKNLSIIVAEYCTVTDFKVGYSDYVLIGTINH